MVITILSRWWLIGNSWLVLWTVRWWWCHQCQWLQIYDGDDHKDIDGGDVDDDTDDTDVNDDVDDVDDNTDGNDDNDDDIVTWRQRLRDSGRLPAFFVHTAHLCLASPSRCRENF